MLRASKDGTKLEVTSVNNEHNHEISEELFKNLPQERKLCGEIKQEVQDLMQLHIDRKRLKEYVRIRTNKVLRSKDLFNIAAANKQKREITPERAYQLFKKIHEIEKLQGCDNSSKRYSESEEEITHSIKKIKHEHESPWGQDGLVDLDASEGNEGEGDCYAAQLTQEEVVNDIDVPKDQLLTANNDGEIVTADGEIVGELVMEDGDPSVIVESIVNADGSVFVDEREFNSYCNNHLSHHDVDDSESSTPQVLDISSVSQSSDINRISKLNCTSPNQSQQHRPLSPRSQLTSKSTGTLNDSDSRIWIMKEAAVADTEADSSPESEPNVSKSTKLHKDEINAADVILSEEASHQLLQEQLAVLRAERGKLFHETEMLKLKKDKLKVQMNCYSNEIRKQEMEKEKLRLEIKLLQSKVMEDANDVSHYIFVP
ncbi:uncharacterized protein LOC105692296 isoform X2 [Athalia rosae]|nr:uncharacterized protein LOC105692296 isoform X2 [Athalia rosae]